MKTRMVRLGLLAALAACGDGSPAAGNAAGADETAQTAQLGDPCGGSPGAACDESQNLYCQLQDAENTSGAAGTCASCADLGSVTLVCGDGTIQAGQWAAISQTCQIIGCGAGQDSPAGDDAGQPNPPGSEPVDDGGDAGAQGDDGGADDGADDGGDSGADDGGE